MMPKMIFVFISFAGFFEDFFVDRCRGMEPELLSPIKWSFQPGLAVIHTLNWVFFRGGALTAIFRGGGRGGAGYFFSSMR